MLIENKLEREEPKPDDLFAVAPPPDTTDKQADHTEIPPASVNETENPAPVVTEPAAREKQPLVFSDGAVPSSKYPGQPVFPQRGKSVMRPKHQAIHLDPGSFSPDAGFGVLLADARRQAGMTEEQVIQITKLSFQYLKALEKSNLKKLPPAVYVAAYVDTLGKLYGLDDESMNLVSKKLNAQPCENDVPPALIQTLEKDRLVNEEEEKRITKFFWAAVSLLILFIAVIVWIVIAMTSHSSSEEHAADITEKPAVMEEPAGKPVFSREDFDALRAPQVPEASTLQMSRKRSLAQ